MAHCHFDDFKGNGYRAYFPGKTTRWRAGAVGGIPAGGCVPGCPQRAGRRYPVSTPGSLAVPASVVLEKVAGFLGSTDRATPLFLYVNFHDTHFPYHYRAIQPLISRTVLEPGDIVPGRSGPLREMYMNTVANVDQAIGTLVAEVTRARGRTPAIIVTSDHGESLFDEGFLGHGYALNDAQTRVPFVAAHLPLVLAQPCAQAELRQAIWDALARVPDGDPRPDFSRVTAGAVFQYLGSVDRPREIGLLSTAGRTLYDFREDRVQVPGSAGWQRPDRLSGGDSASFLGLVQLWERMMIARARSPAPGAE